MSAFGFRLFCDDFSMTDFALVDPEVFATCLETPEGQRSPIVLEAHFSSVDHPLPEGPPRRHIPGAIQVHPSYLESGLDSTGYYPNYRSPADSNVLPEMQLTGALRSLDIGPDSEVWIYGTHPDGVMAAARLSWGLLFAGIKTVRLLDGGIDAWIAWGGRTVSRIPHALGIADSSRRADRDLGWTVRSEYRATTDEVREISRSYSGMQTRRLIDVRRPDEYNGTQTGYYPFFSKAGHIPNAVLQGNWINLVDGETQRIRPVLENVRERWTGLGIVDESVERGGTALIFYCGTGWRSSLSFLVATLLGYRAKNFDDGFYGWSWNEENEIAYGEETEDPARRRASTFAALDAP